MANIRVRSTDGNNADDGSTWALAKADLHTATTGGLASAGAGGTCYVSQAHAQTQASGVTLASPGTYDSPVSVICGSDAADPPTSASDTATVTNSSTAGMTFTGSTYYRGIDFQLTATGLTTTFTVNGDTSKSRTTFDNCSLLASGSAGEMVVGAASTNSRSVQMWKQFDLRLASATSATVKVYNAQIRWLGGALLTQTNLPTILFTPQSGYGCDVELHGVDLSVLGSGKSLVSGATEPIAARVAFHACKFGASVSLVSQTPAVASLRVSAYNCDSGDTNYKLWIEDHSGTILSETTLVRTGGASDGTTPISWSMTSNTNASEFSPLVSDPIYLWNETTGSSKTLTVEILHDSATNLTDAEAWVEVEYLGTSGVPLGSLVSDTRASILATAADQTTSSETWTTTGMTNPNKQALSVSFTPQEKGFAVARVYLAKASKTVYVCPKATVS